MRKTFKKAAALGLAAVIGLSATACSTPTWCAKSGEDTLAVGAYIYTMVNAYTSANYQVTDSSTPVLEQKIEDQPAAEWIENQTQDSIRTMLATNKKFEEMGLSFTSEEIDAINKSIDSGWAQYSKTLEGMGVSKDSYGKVAVWQGEKYYKIFDAIYGEGGEKEVSDSEVESFFKENYTSYSYFTKSLKTTDKDGKSTDMTEEEINKVKEAFEGYAKQVNEDDKSMEDVAKTYKTDDSLESDPLKTSTTILDNSSLSDDLKTALKDLKNGEATAIKSGTTYYVICKNDINDQVEKLSNESDRANVLSQMKSEEFNKTMEEYTKGVDVQFNDAALKKYTAAYTESQMKKS